MYRASTFGFRVPVRAIAGRDALLAARHGHTVVGVDLSAVGVGQMLEDAQAEGLDVEGVVADIREFRSRRKFNVVILDRVLHLLADDPQRRACLARAEALTRKSGFVLVADTPMHRSLIHGFFHAASDRWAVRRQSKNYLFARKR